MRAGWRQPRTPGLMVSDVATACRTRLVDEKTQSHEEDPGQSVIR
jgi:hypothetical protein